MIIPEVLKGIKDILGIVPDILDKDITITADSVNWITGEVTNPEISIYSPSDKLEDIKTGKVAFKDPAKCDIISTL